MAKFMRTDGARGGLRRVAKVPAGDVGIDEPELALDDLERPREAGVGHRRAGAEVEVGHQPREPQDGRRAAVGRVGGGQRGVQRLDREGDRVRVVALEEQEARDRARVGRRGHGAAVGLEAADGLQQRERLAVEQVRCPRPPRSAARRAASAAPCRRTRSPRPPAGRRGPRRAASCGRSRPRTARSARARRRRRCTGRSAPRPRCCAAAGPRWKVLIASHISPREDVAHRPRALAGVR